MNQRIAAFYHYDIEGLRDKIEEDLKPGERIAQVSHAQAVTFDNDGNGRCQRRFYYSAIVIFEKDGGTA